MFPGEAVQRSVDVFERDERDGAGRPVEAAASRKLAAVTAEIPDAPGTYGLLISVGGGEATRVVVSHVRCRRAYRNLIYFHEVDKGGHFAAGEPHELFAAELRAAFKSLR